MTPRGDHPSLVRLGKEMVTVKHLDVKCPSGARGPKVEVRFRKQRVLVPAESGDRHRERRTIFPLTGFREFKVRPEWRQNQI